MKRSGRWWMTVLWPAFLMAGAIEAVVFALVDPRSLRWPTIGPAPSGASTGLGLPDLAVYSLAFFVFWAVCAAGAALVMLLAAGREEINAPGGRA